MRKGNNGFTLVEVIVSIALIGILAVGILPVFAAQLNQTISTREVTSKGFDAQGAIEDAINELENLLKDANAYSGSVPSVTKTIFGRSVTLYQVSKPFPLNANKSFIVFLSEKLAEMAYTKPLEAETVRIDGVKTSGSTVAAIAVASVRTSSDLSKVKGFYSIKNYTSSQDLNLYRWYRSLEGFSDPKFPENYEQIDDLRNCSSITKAELKEYAANRYLMMSLIPVDKSGVRGDEVPSANRVYVQADDWRSDIVAWTDKNSDIIFNTDDGDAAIRYQGVKSNWILLQAAFNTQKSYFDPVGEKTYDISDSSLYVPMGVERPQVINKVGSINASQVGEIIDWTVDKGINIANVITANNSDISMRTHDGSIAICQFVDINTTSGTANYGGDGKVILANAGTSISTNRNISLNAGDDWGSINLEPYTSLAATGNIGLTAAEYVNTSKSSITAGGNVTIKSEKETISIKETQLSASHVNLLSNTTFIGGSWNSGTTVVVSDGKILLAKKGTAKIANAGSLALGNTGAITFGTSMADDIAKPLNLTLSAIGTDEVSISNDYGRNVGYAESKGPEFVSTFGTYQDLGSGHSNLEYTISNANDGGYGSQTVTFAYDGGKIKINASGNGASKRNYILTVRDKYASGVTGSINFKVYSDGSTSPEVTLTGTSVERHRVAFYTGLNGDQLWGNPVYVEDGKVIDSMPSTPTISGYNFKGWFVKLSGSEFTASTRVYDDTIVAAQFDKKTEYRVAFCDNLGLTDSTFTKPPVTVSASNNKISNIPVITWSGSSPSTHTFMGWNSERNCSGYWLTTSTQINEDITFYAQWGNRWSNIANTSITNSYAASYFALDGVKFQKLSNSLLLSKNLVRDGSNTYMNWTTAQTVSSNFRNSFSRIWINGSDFIDPYTLEDCSVSDVLNIGTAWWSSQSSYYSYRSFYVDSSGYIPYYSVDKTTDNIGCRPALSVNNTTYGSKLYGVYVWSGSNNFGTIDNPYILYYLP